MHLVCFVGKVLIAKMLNDESESTLLAVAECELALQHILSITSMSRSIDVSRVSLIDEMLEERSIFVGLAHESILEVRGEDGGPGRATRTIEWLTERIFLGIIICSSHGVQDIYLPPEVPLVVGTSLN